MARIVAYVFSGGGLVSAILASIIWIVLADSTVSRFVLAAVVVAYLGASVYAAPAAVCAWLNGGSRWVLSRDDVGPGRTALILLSGRVEAVEGWDGRNWRVLSRTCAARVLEAVRVHDLIAPEWVISAGGLSDPSSRVLAAADVMKGALVELGVPASRILLEAKSRNTQEEAVNVIALLQQIGAEQSVLVTSEVHLPRSLAAFRARGVSPVPAPAPDPDQGHRWPGWILPSQHGLRFSAEVAHELLGTLYYRLRGWSRPSISRIQ